MRYAQVCRCLLQAMPISHVTVVSSAGSAHGSLLISFEPQARCMVCQQQCNCGAQIAEKIMFRRSGAYSRQLGVQNACFAQCAS